MKNYKVYVNGKLEGSIKTNEPIRDYIEREYSGVKFSIDEKKKSVHLVIGLVEAMKRAMEMQR